METGDTRYIYKNNLDKACFQHDMAYNKYKYLDKRTQSDKNLKDNALKIAVNPRYNEYERGLASMVYKFFFDKKSKGAGLKKHKQLKVMSFINQLLKTLKKGKCILPIKKILPINIWGVDLADMQLINKHKKWIKYLLCAINLYSKYVWVVPLKDKKGVNIVNALQSILNNSKRKLNKI